MLRPGSSYGSLSAYGDLGPWASRRGFDFLVQATGLDESRKRKPPESRAKGIAVSGARSCQRLPARLSACSWRACARPAKAEARWCVFRSQLPGVGSGLLGPRGKWLLVSAAFARRCRRLVGGAPPRSALCAVCGMPRNCRRRPLAGRGRRCRSVPILQFGLQSKKSPACSSIGVPCGVRAQAFAQALRVRASIWGSARPLAATIRSRALSQ